MSLDIINGALDDLERLREKLLSLREIAENDTDIDTDQPIKDRKGHLTEFGVASCVSCMMLVTVLRYSTKTRCIAIGGHLSTESLSIRTPKLNLNNCVVIPAEAALAVQGTLFATLPASGAKRYRVFQFKYFGVLIDRDSVDK